MAMKRGDAFNHDRLRSSMMSQLTDDFKEHLRLLFARLNYTHTHTQQTGTKRKYVLLRGVHVNCK